MLKRNLVCLALAFSLSGCGVFWNTGYECTEIEQEMNKKLKAKLYENYGDYRDGCSYRFSARFCTPEQSYRSAGAALLDEIFNPEKYLSLTGKAETKEEREKVFRCALEIAGNEYIVENSIHIATKEELIKRKSLLRKKSL